MGSSIAPASSDNHRLSVIGVIAPGKQPMQSSNVQTRPKGAHVSIPIPSMYGMPYLLNLVDSYGKCR